MKTVTLAALAPVVLGLFLAACGDSGPTRGSQCRDVLTTYCNRAGGPCQHFAASEISACIESGVTACCMGNCGAGVTSTNAQIDTCEAAINAATCASLDVQNGGSVPAICVGVVRSALTSEETAAFESTEGPGASVGRVLSR
jgi:hypothetical protein